MDRTVELAKEYGTYFYGFDDGIRCWECTNTRLYEIALKENKAIHFKGPDKNCYYEGKIDRVEVFKRIENGKQASAFMAKDYPCTVKDAFYRALMEKWKLSRFLIANVEPRNFHSIRDFKAVSTLEKQTSEKYKSISI